MKFLEKKVRATDRTGNKGGKAHRHRSRLVGFMHTHRKGSHEEDDRDRDQDKEKEKEKEEGQQDSGNVEQATFYSDTRVPFPASVRLSWPSIAG